MLIYCCSKNELDNMEKGAGKIMVKTAVILAAGMGTRLNGVTKGIIPKFYTFRKRYYL